MFLVEYLYLCRIACKTKACTVSYGHYYCYTAEIPFPETHQKKNINLRTTHLVLSTLV